MAPGELVRVDGTELRLRFLEVTGDSRCPVDAFCIQGGDALVHVQAIDGTTARYELHTGDSSRATVTHGSYRIELAELQPYPFSSRPVQSGDYRATFVVSRP